MIKSLTLSHSFHLKLATVALAILGLSGCSGVISGAGPYKGAIESENTTYNLVEINANTIAPYMRGAVRPMQANIAKPLAPSARLMPGDVLSILITDNAPATPNTAAMRNERRANSTWRFFSRYQAEMAKTNMDPVT